MDDNNLMITLETEEGDIECNIIAFFDVEDRNYVALLPVEDNNNEILLFKYCFVDEEEEEIQLINIEDENEFEQALDVFDRIMEEDGN